MYENEHEDGQEDLEALKPIITVIQQMLDKMDRMDEEIDALSKLVNEEIIGGITKLYNTKERCAGISSVSEKYGSLMGPYKDFYSEMTGEDIFEKLHDELEEFKKSADQVDDAAIDAKVQELAELVKSKFEKVKSLGSAPSVVEVEVTSEPEMEKTGTDAILEKIRRMKAKSGDIQF